LKFLKRAFFFEKIVKRTQIGRRTERFLFLAFGHATLHPALEDLGPPKGKTPRAGARGGRWADHAGLIEDSFIWWLFGCENASLVASADASDSLRQKNLLG
jgi:hypothetical protein